MKNIYLWSFLLFSIFIYPQNVRQSSNNIQKQEPSYSLNQFIVLLDIEASNNVNLNDDRKKNVIGIQSFDNLSENYNITSIEYCFKQDFTYPKKAKALGLDRYLIVKLPENSDLDFIMRQFQNLPEVELVEYNYLSKTHAPPNDPLYDEQWGLKNTGNAKEYGTTNLVGTPGSDINAEPSWILNTGLNNPVTIAILDTGVDYNHPEFNGRMLSGYDFMNNDNDPMDEDFDGHGTSCAGIAAAAGNNGIGVAGVNWGANILPVKVLHDGSGTNTAVANGIIFAVDNGADVISMSLGSSFPSSLIENAVIYAYNANVLVFASRGNGDNTADNYPSSYSSVISVGGLSPCNTRKTPTSCDGEFWWGASYGGGPDKMDFVAPAARITTTDITGFGGYSSNDYTDSFNGTSSACPFAAGVGALIKSYNPSLNVDEIRNILRITAVDIEAVGYDDETGFGKINAEAALLEAIPYDYWFSVQDNSEFDTCNSTDTASISFDFFRLPTAANEDVTLTLTGEPFGLLGLFSPIIVTNENNFTLNLSGISTLSTGEYNFSVLGQSTSFSYDLPVTLNVYDSLTQNVNLTYPLDNQNSLGIPFEFEWDSLTNASFYQIQIATDLGFTNIIEDAITEDDKYTSLNITEGSEYYWRVKPINPCGDGTFSSAFSFITACNNTANLTINFASVSELNLVIENSNASSWEIEYVLSGTAPSGTGSIYSTLVPSFDNLNSDTCYDFYIRSDCAIGFSNWNGPFQFCTSPDYCNGDLFYDSGGPNGNYSNNEYSITTIFPEPGSNTITVNFNSFQTENCCDYMQIFDGDDINAPFVGEYRGTNSPGSITSTGPTGALTFLFDTDFSVTSTGWEASVTCQFISCKSPTNFETSNLSQTSADLNWIAGDAETEWEIEYGPTGFSLGSGTTLQANSTTTTLSGLNVITTYDAYLRANCGTNPGDDDSIWVGPLTFTTLDIYPPSSLTAELIDQVSGSVDLNWSEPNNVVGDWDFYWNFDCSGSYSNTVTTFNSDNTFVAPASGSFGTWVLNGGQITITFSNGFEYTGIVAGNYMSGSNEAGGCWYANQISPGSDSVITDYTVSEILSNGESALNPDEIYTHTFTQNFSSNSVQSYNVYRDNVVIASTVNTTYTDILPTFGSYDYHVTAVYSVGESSPSNIETVIWSSCPEPTDLLISNITGDGADISWTNGHTETQWDIEYGITGFTQGSGTIVQTNTNPYSLTGLSALTTYDVYLRANCGANPGDDDSNWSGPISFTTLCASFAAPYTEDFESFTANFSPFVEENCWTSTGGVYFWEVAQTNDTSSSGTGPAPGVSTGNYFFTEASNGSSGSTTDLISPIVDLTALTTPALEFDYHMFGDDMGTLEVLVNGTDNVFSISGQQNLENDPFTNQLIDLSAYANQSIFVVFRGIRGFGFESDIAIDNISFNEMPTCPKPSALAVSNLTANSVDVSWNVGSSETQWEIEYGLTGFTQGSGTVVQVNTNPYMLTGLNSQTSYDIYLRANCGVNPGDDDSIWVGPVNFITQPDYCNGDLFYDTGGPNGNYSNGENILTTIYPSTGTNTITVDFNSFQTESCCDRLRIYDGDDTNAPLIGQYQGLNSPGSVTSTSPSGALTFLFTSDGSVTRPGWEASVSCEFISCPEPSNLIASSITQTSVDLSWDAGDSETQWEIEYGITGFTQGNGTIVQTNTNPYSLTGLSALTTYDVYLRANCGANPGDDDSNWSGPISFTTLCASFTAPYTEDFESFTANFSPFVEENCWTSTGGVYFWEVAQTNDTSSSGTGPAAGVSTGNYFFTEASNGSSGSTTDLISPIIDLTALTTPALEFDYHMFGDDMGTLEVLVNGTDNVFSISGQQNLENDPFTNQLIDLSAYANQSIFVVFRGIRGFGFESDIAIDNISFNEMPTCPKPSALAVSNLTASSVDVSWNVGSSETQWEIEYGPTGFTQGSGTIVQVNTNPYMLTGLNSQTSYDIYLRANCGVNPGDDDSIWVGPVNFITQPDYCNGDLFYDTGGPNGNYSNGENILTTIYPSAGTNTITVDFNSFQTESCCDRLRIYDGDDTNAPLIGQYQGLNSPGSVTSTSPSGALTFLFTSDGSVTRPGWEASVSCEFISCPEPSNLIASNITQTSVDLSWDAGDSETQWEIEYGITGFTQGNGAIVQTNTNPYSLTGLSALTTYDVYLRANCGANPGDDDSNWSGPISFTTLCASFTAPYTEDFESFTVNFSPFVEENCWTSTGGVYFWEVAQTNDTSSSGTGPAPGVSTGNYFFTEASNGSSGSTTDLISPIVDLTALTTPALEFDYHMFGDDMGTLEVLVNGTDNVFSISGQQNLENDPFTNQLIDLSAYTNQSIFVVFRGIRGFGFESDIAIDNISFNEMPTCPKPSALAVSNLTANSVDVSWNVGSSETQWEIEYGLTGFTQGSGTVVQVNTNPYMLTGLNSQTSYDIYLRANCGVNPGDDDSIWVGPVNFTTQPDYCNGDLFYDTGGPNGNYSNGENIVTTIYPSAGSNTITVDFLSFQTESCCDRLRIYDGDDTNAPLIGQYQGTNSPGSITSSNPGGALTFLFTSDGSVTRPGWEAVVTCQFISCPEPSNLIASNITQTSVDLIWDAGDTETQWEIEYGITGFTQGSGTVVQTNTNPYNLTGLNSLTTYDVYLRANCGANPGDDDSNWVDPVTFTTLDLYPPGNLTAEITDQVNGTVDLNWNEATTVVGEWIINLSVNCNSIIDVTAPLIFYDDFTFEVPTENSSGTWVYNVDQIIFTFNNGFQYTGTVQGGYMSGTNSAGGCWYADQISSGPDSNSIEFTTSELLINGASSANPGDIYTYTFTQDNITNTIQSYNVYRDNINIASTVNTNYTDILPNYGTYDYYVTAVYSAGESVPSNIETVVWTTCPEPTNFLVTNVSGDSATMSWDNGNSETQWEIEYGTPGFTQGSGTLVQVNSNPFTITGLNAVTTYDVYLRANCGANPGDDDSFWVGPFSFTTTCGVYVAPMYEHFTNTSLPNCWEENGSENWIFSLGAAYDASSAGDHTPGQNTNYAWIDGSTPNGPGHISHLRTMEIDVSQLVNPALQFSVFSVNTDDFTYNTLSVTVTNSVNESLNVLTMQNTTSDWSTYTIDLSNITLNSNIIRVEFSIEENSPGFAYYNDILIDDVIIDESEVLNVEEFDVNALSYYPNPISDVLHVKYSKTINKIEIYNLLGQNLKNINAKSSNVDINMSFFSSGTYILKIYSGSSYQVIKVIKR